MKINSKFTLILLCISIAIMATLSCVLLFVNTFGLLTQTAKIGNQVSVEETADPTKPQTFYIDSPEDLDNVRENMYQKDEEGNFITSVPNIFIQICDIDMSNFGNFTPIGNNNYVFDGTYIGNGFSISGLTISSTATNIGLFGVIGENGSVDSLSIVNLTTTDTISGGTNVGAIAGTNNGTITLSSNYSTISGTNVGGIAGVNNGTIEKSFNTGTLSGTAGGIASQNTGTISNCFNMADFSGGGIANQNSGTISNCYNVGNVDVGISNAGTVNNSYYLQGMSTTGLGTEHSIDVFVGFDDTNNLANLLNQGQNIWRFDHSYVAQYENEELNYQFPHLIDNYTNLSQHHVMKISLDGRYYIIENTAMFNAIGGSYNGINYSTQSNYILNTDLDFQNSAPNTIGEFQGEFNGNGYTIENVSKNINTTNLGLFDSLSANAYVHDLYLDAFNITNNNGENTTNAGTLAGYVGNNVILSNIYVSNSIVTSNGNTGAFIGSCNTEYASGTGYIKSCGVYNSQSIGTNGYEAADYSYGPTGGFVGKIFAINNPNQHYISNCFVASNSSSYIATGDISIGGFVGEVESGANLHIVNSLSYGNVHSNKDYTWGSTLELDCVGGFIGINHSNGFTIQYSYAHVNVSRENTTFGIGQVSTRAFGHNSGNGTFLNNYALSQGCDESSGATDTSDFSSLFSNSNAWSSGSSIGNISNISVPNQGSISILTDNNSSITVKNEVGTQFNNLSGLPYGTYTVEISRYGQSEATTYTITLSDANRTEYIFDKSFYSGDGTQNSPYRITNISHLQKIDNFNGAYFSVENNINAFNSSFIPNEKNTSISIDGNGRSIYNFNINSQINDVGLFSTLTSSTIQNLKIYTFEINSTNVSNTGVLAGNISNTSTISNINIEFGSITANSGNVGGIAGTVDNTTITNASVNINITSNSQNGYAGGLVGVATGNSSISLSCTDGVISGGNYLGGFVGSAENVTISDSYTITNVSSTYNNLNDSEIGGFAGYIGANSTINSTFMYGSIKSENKFGNVGVYAGINNSSNLQNNYAWNVNNYKLIFTDIENNNGVTFLTTDEFVTEESFVNFDFTTTWILEETHYPIFR